MPPRVALIVVLIVVHVSVVGSVRHPTAAALSLEDIDSRTEQPYSPVGANQATRFVDDPMAALPYSRVPKQVAREFKPRGAVGKSAAAGGPRAAQCSSALQLAAPWPAISSVRRLLLLERTPEPLLLPY